MENLGIIMLIFFLAIAILVGGLVGNKVGIHKKEIIPQVTSQEECSKGICPVPKNWKGEK